MSAGNATPLIDCCVHTAWSSAAELVDYLPAGWREYVAANVSPEWSGHLRGLAERPPGALVYPPMMPAHAYPHPGGGLLPGMPATAGSDYATVRREHLDAHGVEGALVCPEQGLFVAALPQPRLSVEIARAANRWTAERWLDADERLHGSIVVSNQLPDQAVAEARRAAEHPRMVAVLMGANGLGKPFGHPAYEPIYAVCAELDLTVVIHAGADAIGETLALASAAGPSSTFAEYYSLLAQTHMSHMTSIISQGVFERYPGLRVLLLGGGAMWVAPFLWRFDTEFQGMRIDAPWLRRLPSEYFAEHVRVGTHPADPAPSTDALVRSYRALGGVEEMLCFASGYPRWDTVSPVDTLAWVPEGWRERIMSANARKLFRWQLPSALQRTASSEEAR